MKKKYLVIALSILFLSTLIFFIIKNVHKKDNDESKIVVKNGLSINYLNGDDIIASKKEKKYVFSITNDSELDKYYQIEVKDVEVVDNISYEIVCDETHAEKKGTDLKKTVYSLMEE